jgi:hypothetical protein
MPSGRCRDSGEAKRAWFWNIPQSGEKFRNTFRPDALFTVFARASALVSRLL